MKYMIIKREEYEFMKDTIDRLFTDISNKIIAVDVNLSNAIKELEENLSSKIEYLQHNNNIVLDKLQMAETARKTNAGKLGGLTTSLNKEKKENEELQNKVKDLEVKLEESMSDKYRVKKIPAGRRPKTQTMKLKNCSVESNIARKMFGDSK